MLVEVAIALPNFDPFFYLVPHYYRPFARPGCYVLVPFRNEFKVGVITKLPEKNPIVGYKIREIALVIGLSYSLNPGYLDFLKWLADYYLCALGEVIAAAVPTLLIPKANDFDTAKLKIPKAAGSKLPLNFERANPWLLAGVPQAKFKIGYLPVSAKGETKKRLLKKLKELKKLKGGKGGFTTEKLAAAKITFNALKSAFSEGWLVFAHKDSELFQNVPTIKPFTVELTVDQQKIGQKIKASLAKKETKQPFLIQGVTGSGKTMIYIAAAKEALARKKSVLILLPEIALTPQIMEQFSKAISGAIFMQHSKLSPRKRALAWLQVKNSACCVVIGTRSAIFCPINNLGLIVVDEEHDPSFRQQERPFYNARDLSIVLSRQNNALVILGTATPAVESTYNAQQNKYQLEYLKQRPLNIKLPEINLLDLRHQRRHQRYFYLAESTFSLIKETLSAGKQVLIFLNRRGYARILVCRNCDEVATCKNCSIPLTWHISSRQFLCHRCQYHEKWIKNCSFCDAQQMKLEGIGTERIEADLKLALPEYKVVRADSDALPSAAKMADTFSAIKEHKVNIIIGTQMIAKGHDFPAIGLVVVPLADLGLNIPDFRASERTFQMLSQVAGRAGRAENLKASVLIQSYNPNHPAIQAAIKQDFGLFFNYELQKRKELKDPPFYRLALLAVNDLDEKAAKSAVFELHKFLKPSCPPNIIIDAPITAPIYRINKRYQWEIKLRSLSAQALKAFLKKNLWENKAQKLLKKSRLLIKIDP